MASERQAGATDRWNVALAQHARADLLRDASSRAPEEACGLLLGRWTGHRPRTPGREPPSPSPVVPPSLRPAHLAVEEVSPCANVAPSRQRAHRYVIDPLELLREARCARERHLDLVGFYHSHPAGPPAASVDDSGGGLLAVACVRHRVPRPVGGATGRPAGPVPPARLPAPARRGGGALPGVGRGIRRRARPPGRGREPEMRSKSRTTAVTALAGVLLALGQGCASSLPVGRAGVCPDYQHLSCLTAVECAPDRARGCDVCRCSSAGPRYLPAPAADQREAIPVTPPEAKPVR